MALHFSGIKNLPSSWSHLEEVSNQHTSLVAGHRITLRPCAVLVLTNFQILVITGRIIKMSMEELSDFFQGGLEKDFGYDDDQVIETLRASMEELHRSKLDLPPPREDSSELPTKPFGQFVQPTIEKLIGRRSSDVDIGFASRLGSEGRPVVPADGGPVVALGPSPRAKRLSDASGLSSSRQSEITDNYDTATEGGFSKVSAKDYRSSQTSFLDNFLDVESIETSLHDQSGSIHTLNDEDQMAVMDFDMETDMTWDDDQFMSEFSAQRGRGDTLVPTGYGAPWNQPEVVEKGTTSEHKRQWMQTSHLEPVGKVTMGITSEYKPKWNQSSQLDPVAKVTTDGYRFPWNQSEAVGKGAPAGYSVPWSQREVVTKGAPSGHNAPLTEPEAKGMVVYNQKVSVISINGDDVSIENPKQSSAVQPAFQSTMVTVTSDNSGLNNRPSGVTPMMIHEFFASSNGGGHSPILTPTQDRYNGYDYMRQQQKSPMVSKISLVSPEQFRLRPDKRHEDMHESNVVTELPNAVSSVYLHHAPSSSSFSQNPKQSVTPSGVRRKDSSTTSHASITLSHQSSKSSNIVGSFAPVSSKVMSPSGQVGSRLVFPVTTTSASYQKPASSVTRSLNKNIRTVQI